MKRAATAAALALCLGSAACAHRPCPCSEEQPAPPPATAPEPRPYEAIDGITGLPLEAPSLDARLRAARVIFVGEQHDDAAHHAVQVDMLTRLHQLDPSLAVAFEMLPHTAQPALDAFIAGKVDEATFLQQVAWNDTWGFPFGLYRPLLTFARDHALRAYALNAPRALTRALSRGGIESLSPSELQGLPEMVPGPAAHREFARQAFAAHVSRRFSDHAFERFYQAQLAWDETMAAQLARHAQAPGAPSRVLVIAGEGHTRRFAVPLRTSRRGVSPALLVLSVEGEAAEDARKDQVADVLMVFRPRVAKR